MEEADTGAAVSTGRTRSLIALLAVAIVTGGLVGALLSSFIWLYENGIAFMWTDLPDRVGVEPYGSWWLFAIPVVGGALVGLGQRVLGNYPASIDESLATWRAGGRIEPWTTPRTFVNSAVSLLMGGPVGFEAALTGLLGGSAAWVGDRIGSLGRLVRQAWGGEPIDGLPSSVRHLPHWLAAISGLLVYRWLPFGALDTSFRFSAFDGSFGVGDAAAVFVFAAIVVVPVAWALSVVSFGERATWFQRSPILIGMAGGLLFAVLAIPSDLVLFSGQQGIQSLPDTGGAELAYVAVAKWAALIIALLAGWRGGPVFPTFTAVAAVGVLVSGPLPTSPQLMMVAGITAVSVAFVKGRLALAFVLCLYPVPLSWAVVIVTGCLGAAAVLVVARSAGLLPPEPTGAADPPEPTGTTPASS